MFVKGLFDVAARGEVRENLEQNAVNFLMYDEE